ncbi:MAG: hypothetical protein NVSMB46_03660 [Candidatus Saccharimonadales bacterium]
MLQHTALLLTQLADVSVASREMNTVIAPVMLSLTGIAALVASFFLVTAGFTYITSSGHPEKLEQAKQVIRNALIGLVIVISAAVMTGVLSHAYRGPSNTGVQNIPALSSIAPSNTDKGLAGVLIKAIIGLFKYIVESAAAPFLKALSYFTKNTPLMGDNNSIYSMWLIVVGIADSLFVVFVALLGFHVMSASTLGLDEIEFKHLLPQIGVTFLLINTSLFAIDTVIGISNGMIHAVDAAFSSVSVWEVLSSVVSQASGLSLVALLIMVVFVILAIILLVYYVMRLVVLYLGAILSPIVILLLLLPSFRQFAITAIKTYATTIFVLFIHVLLLHLAATIFSGMLAGSTNKTLDPLMAGVVGLATLTTLLKTQGLMMQLSYVSVGPKALKKLGSQFMNGVSYTTEKVRSVRTAPSVVESE